MEYLTSVFFFIFFQVGYSTSSPSLSNKEKFPLYFRTSTTEIMENPSRLALLKYFKWKRVALIVQNLDIFEMVRSVFLSLVINSDFM